MAFALLCLQWSSPCLTMPVFGCELEPAYALSNDRICKKSEQSSSELVFSFVSVRCLPPLWKTWSFVPTADLKPRVVHRDWWGVNWWGGLWWGTRLSSHGCVRLGNPDLDFEIRIADFQSNAKSENGFHLREIRLRGGFQLRNPNLDFMDFLVTVWLGNPKKYLQNCSRKQWSSFC